MRGELLRGVRIAGPIIFGYAPVGLTFGLLARTSGLSPLQAVAMSALVYAGSAQFVGLAMLSAGAPAAAIVTTTAFVNLRHVLFGASIARFLEGTTMGRRALLAHGLTDETFAVSSLAFQEGIGSPWAMLGTNLTAYGTWLITTAVGAVAGAWIGDVTRLGVQFAIPAMFVGLMALLVRTKGQMAVAGASAVLAVAFRSSLGPEWYVVATALVGATVGVVMKRSLASS